MGEVTVDGPGSTWNNGSNMEVGYAGDGILNIANGVAVSDSSGYIGGYVGSPSVCKGWCDGHWCCVDLGQQLHPYCWVQWPRHDQRFPTA